MKLTVPPYDTVDLDRVNLADPVLYSHGDPHAIWYTLRSRAPVWWQQLPDGRGFWSVTRYPDACRVLRDHQTFTSERGTLLSALGHGDPAGGLMMAASDPPRHTVLREGLNRALAARQIAARRDELRVPVQRLLRQVLVDGPCDLADAAAQFPMEFIGALMGVPEEDWPRLTMLTTMAIAPDDPDFRGDGPGRVALVAAHHELFQYFSRQVTLRAGRPSADLIGLLMSLELDGAPLSHEAVIYNCYSLILGANVTTPHTITAAVQVLAEWPDIHRRIREDRRLVRSFLEEALRWSSPANHFMRYARRDVRLGGRDIPSGDAVVVWLGSANRDEDVFARPYQFDVERHPNPHIAFGYGPHFCIGAALARTSLELLFDEIVARVDRFELAGTVDHLASNFVAGFKRFPVQAHPVAGTSTTPEAVSRHADRRAI